MKTITADELHRQRMKNPVYCREYDALAEEFALAHALLAARGHAGLTQAQVARRMKTTQTAVARLDGSILPRGRLHVTRRQPATAS